MPLRTTMSADAIDLRTGEGVVELGPVKVWTIRAASAHSPERTTTAPRPLPPLHRLTLVPHDMPPSGGHAGPASSLDPRILLTMTGSRLREADPYGADSAGRRAADRAVEGVAVEFPQALLSLPAPRVRGLLGRGLTEREGTGALLTDFLLGLVRQAPSLRPADAPRLGAVVLDLVSVWLAQVVRAEAGRSEDACQYALAERIRAYIEEHLHDPELTPGTIADAHHISLSHLHRVFTEQSGGETVAAWIRRRRLENARRDLADPLLRTTPIQSVATRWGMPRPSCFARAFRAAYGESPREHRHRSLTGES
ncbi:helix-turn-helix domain-containing protein [Streptomyces sp. NPDC014779]|uniref:helix-turn-helix domain-containing protein n=1 Tax=unclassified Streptomyces TaxID=2593676 RepID=UPI0036FEE4F5